MTNFEWIKSLNEEELANILNTKPWENSATLIWYDGYGSYVDGIVKWLESTTEEDDW